MTEDTNTGSLEDPFSLNRYIYARNNPERIVDPNGHDWFSTIGSDLTNGVKSLGSALTSQQAQAIALTVGLDAAAVAVAVVAPEAFATPEGGALLGAASNATTVEILSGGQASLGGVVKSGASGALIGFATGGVGEFLAPEEDIGAVASDLGAQGIQRVAVIGEGQEARAIPFARALEARGIAAETFEPSAPDLSKSALMNENMAWINSMKSSGIPIVDIGPSPLNAPPVGNYPEITSDFYQMELRQTANYPGYIFKWGAWLF